MMTATPRRMFLHTAGAALALPFVGGDIAAAQTRRGDDPVLAELLRQTKAAARRAASRGGLPTGEAVRQVASSLRVLAAHGSTIGLDAAFTRALRRAGRTAVLTHRVDAEALAAKLRAEGIDADASRLAPVPEDPALRAAALDAVLQRGVTQAWTAAADALEAFGARIDRQRGVQLVAQINPADCASAQWALFMLEITMFSACGPWAVALPEPCIIAAGAYFAFRASMLIWGC